MKEIKKVVILIIAMPPIYYSTYWLFFTFNTIKSNTNTDYIKGIVSAFMGAFFAFILYGFGVLIGKFYKRKLKHVNAVALLEQQLNHCLVINYDNIIILSKFIVVIDKGGMYSVNLKEYKISESILRDLGNIEFSNEVFDFKTDTYKNNESMATVANFYNDFKRLFLDGKIDRNTFELNVRGDFKNDLIFLKTALEEFDEKIEKLMAKSQAMFEFDEPILFWIIRKLAIKEHHSKKFNKFYEERLSILKIQRQNNLEKSTEEIKNTQEKCKNL